MNDIIQKIIKNEKQFAGEVNVKYMFFPSYKETHLLTVAFAGFHAEGEPPKYNYLRTLEEFDCHQLFILDDFGARGSYYMCKNRDFKIERSIKKLIDHITEEYKIEQKIAIGSSKGGSAAIYYGIKYDYDVVIAGSPQFYIGSYLKKVKSANSVLKFMAGDAEEEDVAFLDVIIENIINEKKQIRTKVALCVGKDDSHYMTHSKPLITILEEKDVFYILDLPKYSRHSDIGKFFPKSIKSKLALFGSFSILEDFSAKIENNNLKLNLATTHRDDEVAIYLLNQKKEIIERIGYSLKKDYVLNLEKQVHTVRIFVLNTLGHRYQKNITDFF